MPLHTVANMLASAAASILTRQGPTAVVRPGEANTAQVLAGMGLDAASSWVSFVTLRVNPTWPTHVVSSVVAATRSTPCPPFLMVKSTSKWAMCLESPMKLTWFLLSS